MLSDDLISEVLSWLPPNSLMRFRSVCKSWSSIITSSNFIAQHQSHYGNSLQYNTKSCVAIFAAQKFMVLPNSMLSVVELHLAPDRNPGTIYGPISVPENVPMPCKGFCIKSTCNGLFCFANFSQGSVKILLCNPSIRVKVDIPPIRLADAEKKRFSFLSCGVGFDRLTNDYKVVTFANHCVQDKDPVPSKVELYSPKTESWKTLDGLTPPPYTPEHVSFFLGGFIHWLVLARRENFIMVFDVCNEVFGRMQLPEIDRDWNEEYSISVANGSLYLLATKLAPSCTIFEVWIMKEYGDVESWTKQHTFVHQQLTGYIQPTAGGKFVGYSNNPRELLWYDPETDETKILGQFIAQHSFSLVETLELLDCRNLKLIDSYL